MKNATLSGSIILFDTSSSLHKEYICFIEKREMENTLNFFAFQSEIGQALIKKLNFSKAQLSFIILLENGQYYTQSTAFLKLTRYLKGGWSLARIFLFVPKVIRDSVFQQFLKSKKKRSR